MRTAGHNRQGPSSRGVHLARLRVLHPHIHIRCPPGLCGVTRVHKISILASTNKGTPRGSRALTRTVSQLHFTSFVLVSVRG